MRIAKYYSTYITASNITMLWSHFSAGVERIISDVGSRTGILRLPQRVPLARCCFLMLVFVLAADGLVGTDRHESESKRIKIYCCGPYAEKPGFVCKDKELLAGGFMLCTIERK